MNILRYAFKNIFRNLFLSASSVLIITLLVFFVNILLFVLFATEQFIASINDKISITINFRDGFDDSQVRSQRLISGISEGFTGVKLDYISRESALDILKWRNPDLAALVEQTDDNPLPNSLRLSNIDLDTYGQIDAYIASFQDILQYDQSDMNRKLTDYKSQMTRITQVVHVLTTLQEGVYVLLGLFVFTVFIVVHMIIRNFIFFLRDEVRIIELVGWNPSFIYGPFLVQGLFYTAFSTLLALSVFFLGHSLITIDFISGPLAFVVEWFYEQLNAWSILEVLWFSLIGVISALLASRVYIHSTIGE
jgi:cell division transport system permease protein